MAATDARPIPRKNTAFRVYFPILDADGDLVTGASALDSEVSLDGAAFGDCTSEATEIGSTGNYYLDLTASEMNADAVVVQVKTSSSGAKTTVIVMYPEEAGDIRADVVAISGDSAAADNLEAAADGTGYNLGGGSVVAASVTGAVGSVTGAVGSVAAGGITAGSIAADAIGASELAADAVAEIAAAITAGATAAQIWAYASRTLTQSAAQVADVLAGGPIRATRGDTFSLSLTGLGSITGRQALWFTVKAAPRTDPDSASKVQVTEAGGLLYLNGAAGTSGHGAITVDSAALGNLTIVVAAAATAQLAAPVAWSYDVQWKDATGLIHTLTSGSFLVDADVTWATS